MDNDKKSFAEKLDQFVDTLTNARPQVSAIRIADADGVKSDVWWKKDDTGHWEQLDD